MITFSKSEDVMQVIAQKNHVLVQFSAGPLHKLVSWLIKLHGWEQTNSLCNMPFRESSCYFLIELISPDVYAKCSPKRSSQKCDVVAEEIF